MKDVLGFLALGLAFALISNYCATPAHGDAACSSCACQPYSYTEVTHLPSGRSVVCTVYVDACGNVTRICS